MAISKEDYKDVKSAMGKALANKVRKVSLDKAFPGETRMDKIKSRVGSDNRKVNYEAMYKSVKRHEK